MSHHVKPVRAYSVHNLGTFVDIGNFKFLLEEYGSLLVGGLDYTSHENMVGRTGRRVQERQKVDGLRSRYKHFNQSTKDWNEYTSCAWLGAEGAEEAEAKVPGEA